jgi:3-phenylpropionate/trans-cinnamate dioxygenase ferredoxin reductase component
MDAMTSRIIIVGTGQAGFQAACSLRQEGYTGAITLIGDEPGLPYQRPPLSKGYLKDGRTDRLALRADAFFAKNDLTLIAPATATTLDRTRRAITLADGRVLTYTHLILALGARNRRPPLAGLDLTGVYDLRTLADAERLRAPLLRAKNIVVIGGGFIGLEVAATARAFGANVTVLEAAPRLMARAVTAATSSYFEVVHRDAGIDVRLNAFAHGIVGHADGHASAVALQDGTHVAADLVLVSTGVTANSELAESAGLAVQDGITVDAHLLTADPLISAIGDCAAFPFGAGQRQLRLESVQNAVDQAKCVARCLTGTPEPYAKVPWFWSDQGPHKLQMAGISTDADDIVVRGSTAESRLVAFAFAHQRLIAVETVNAPAVHMASRAMLARPTPLTHAELATVNFDITALARGLKGTAP